MSLRCAVLLAVAPAIHAASFDCSKARTKIEKTICSDPKLSAADEQMAALYKAALANTGRALIPVKDLPSDQVAWLTLIQSRCDNAACLSGAYRGRIRTLQNNSSYSDAPVPKGTEMSDQSLGDLGSFPQLQSPAYHPGVELYNYLVRRAVYDMRHRYGADKCDFEFDAAIVGGRVATSYARIAVAAGGAHPVPMRVVVNVDLNNTREIALADLFTPGPAYFSLLARLTLADLKKQSDAYGWEGEPRKTMFDYFTFGDDGLLIHFPPYAAGSYMDGDLEVNLSMAQLRSVARSGGLLGAVYK